MAIMAEDLISRGVLLRRLCGNREMAKITMRKKDLADDYRMQMIGRVNGYSETIDVVRAMPEANADVEEVIRCKDCFYWGGDDYEDYIDYRPCGKFNEYMRDKDFCSCAYERED